MDQEKTLEKKRGELRRSEETLMRYKKEAERHAAKLQTMADSSPTSQKEAELEHETGRLMVRRLQDDNDREAD